ncbi:hypothetical protein EIN_138250 [Entamoeba invadens IP1]|uniref:Leucine rich repeat containing protein BspA family protein n=1 Tax=Entamoeba invadens IP1 TaxID=370355 RepID=L7FND5_ENTIV|nr:hypothetical protein EIN_138250 [Entamoeba invadens IP1]ELP91808.1 hypothetical protein EIN_138250 [Entamoeba invadens IP1]|eukprot:XP_004258579.1 hypothetical protein EIN_138250 [Entamoeba invadens IP1]
MFVQLDVFNFQIVVQYFYFEKDFINSILMCKKFSFILDRFRYNPIQVDSKRLFPYMETQHLYDFGVVLNDINNIVLWKPVSLTDSIDISTQCPCTFKNISVSLVDIYNKKITTYTELQKLLNNTNIKSYGKHLFYLFGVSEVIIPNTVTSLQFYTFQDHMKLERVTLSESLKDIPNGCFENCVQLKNINFPPSITGIKNNSFYNCGFERLIIPSSIYVIENSAFEKCVKLVDVKISNNVKIIEDYVFQLCTNLSKVELPKKLKFIKTSVFNGCIQLEYVNIPESVCYVDSLAFNNCKKIKDLVFNQKCYIADNAFNNCTSLTKLVVPTLNKKVINQVSKECSKIVKKFYDNYEYTMDNNSELYNNQFKENLDTNTTKEVC